MKLIWLLIALALTSCSHTDTKIGLDEFRAKQDRTVKEFEQANHLLDEGKAAEAAKEYDEISVENPVNQLDMLIVFNAGLAYLQSEDCTTAKDRLRKVVRVATKTLPTLKARAMLKLSDVYTCLGEDNKAITNLIELHAGRVNLPQEIAKAEVPAKLAAAYARIGNNKEAEVYFREAEKGLLEIQNNYRETAKRTEALARTLVQMGSLAQLNTQTMTSDDYFATIKALQKYLFKAVEYNEKDWSERAIEQINLAYDNAWNYIERVSVPDATDSGIATREQQRERLRVAQVAILTLRALFDERIPDPQEPEVVTTLMTKMKTQESKLRNYIATNIVGSALTPEALAAEGLKRSGQVLNPDPILEERALKKMPVKPAKKKTK